MGGKRINGANGHTSQDVYERLGSLEARFDGVENAIGRIEGMINRPYGGPTWVQIATLMLGGGVALAGLLGTFMTIMTTPIREDSKLALSSAIEQNRSIGSLNQQVVTLDKELTNTFVTLDRMDVVSRNNSQQLAEIQGRLSVYERLGKRPDK